MRNNTYHELVPELLKLVADASQPLELRVNTAECLAGSRIPRAVPRSSTPAGRQPPTKTWRKSSATS